jgi:hypothetical protein
MRRIAVNYGSKAAVVKLNTANQVVQWQDVNGDANRCRIIGIAQLQNNLFVFGQSTLLKSPSNIPFLFITK